MTSSVTRSAVMTSVPGSGISAVTLSHEMTPGTMTLPAPAMYSRAHEPVTGKLSYSFSRTSDEIVMRISGSFSGCHGGGQVTTVSWLLSLAQVPRLRQRGQDGRGHVVRHPTVLAQGERVVRNEQIGRLGAKGRVRVLHGPA